MDDGVLRRASNEGDETFAVVRAAGAKGRGKPRARGGRAPLSLADPRLNGGATASADGGIASGDGGGGGGGGSGGHAPRALGRPPPPPPPPGTANTASGDGRPARAPPSPGSVARVHMGGSQASGACGGAGGGGRARAAGKRKASIVDAPIHSVASGAAAPARKTRLSKKAA